MGSFFSLSIFISNDTYVRSEITLNTSTSNVNIAISADGLVRCLALDSTSIVRMAQDIHKTSPVASAALGRALTAAALMTHMLGDNEKLTLQWSGGGPIGNIVVTATANGGVRGFARNPNIVLPVKGGKLDVGSAVGKDGFLYVIKDVGYGTPYMGTVPLISGEIAEDLASYFTKSEQTPSVVALGVLVSKEALVQAAGGYIIQTLPGVTDDVILKLEQNIASVPPVSTMMAEGLTEHQVINMLLSGLDPKILDVKSVSYECTCSKERIMGALISLPLDDLESLAQESEPAGITCDFCRKEYSFSQKELFDLVQQRK